MGYANIQADSNFYRQSLNADGVKYVTGPYTSLYEDVFRAVTVTTDSVVSVTSYVGDSLSSEFLLAGTEIYGLFSSVTIHSGKAVLHLAGASYISEIINQYSASGIPLGFYEEGTQCLSQKISALLTQGLFDDASWVMVPSQYKEDTVRAFKPTSTLGDLTFTRASDATYTDSTGVVRRSPYNLLTYSEQFNDTAWTKQHLTISANVIDAPNGTLTADKIIPSTLLSYHPLGQVRTVISGTIYSFSIYAKAGEYNFLLINTASGSLSGNVGPLFNLSNGTLIGSLGGNTYNAQIVSVGNGWYRISFSFTTNATSAIIDINTFPTSTIATYSGNGTDGAFLWGAQLVEGTEPLDYFPTTDRLNVPRIDFRNADGTLSTCGRLLLEPQRTNVALYSEQINNAAWGKLNVTVSANQAVGPDGTTSADLVYPTTTGADRVIEQLPVAVIGQTWTSSFFVKASGFSWVLMYAPNLVACWFNASTGVFGTIGAGATATVLGQVNGYWRISLTGTVASSNAYLYVGPADANGTTTATANGTNGILIWGCQLEQGAYPTTYIPTTTAAVTRLADTASKTGVSSLIGQSAGTIFWDINDLTGTPTGTGNPDLGIRNAAETNWVAITTNTFASPFRVTVRPTSGTIIDYTANISRAKAAVAWSTAGAVLYVNGVQVGTSATNPNFSFDIIQMLGGRIVYKTNQAAIFPVRLDNATLAALTTL